MWGKPTDLPWGFGVPNEAGVLVARHPSQLYEAGLEGLVLFGDHVVVHPFAAAASRAHRPVLLHLRLRRFVVEWVRLPDANIGYLVGDWLTMGMLLTTPMILIGLVLLVYAYRRAQPSGNRSLGNQPAGGATSRAGA